MHMCRAVRQTAEAENNITSVERILDYTRLPSEPPRVAEGTRHLKTCSSYGLKLQSLDHTPDPEKGSILGVCQKCP